LTIATGPRAVGFHPKFGNCCGQTHSRCQLPSRSEFGFDLALPLFPTSTLIPEHFGQKTIDFGLLSDCQSTFAATVSWAFVDMLVVALRLRKTRRGKFSDRRVLTPAAVV